MFHLAVLLANPNVEIPAAELAAGVAGIDGLDPSGRQPLLDRRAIQQLRQRVAQLAADRHAATDGGAPGQVMEARTEQDWLVAELRAGIGPAGRVRAFSDQAERARIAVGKAIRRAVARIGSVDAETAEHLRQTIHTGVRCAYRPLAPFG